MADTNISGIAKVVLQARADMKELYNVRANVEHLLDISTGRETQRDTQKSRQ